MAEELRSPAGSVVMVTAIGYCAEIGPRGYDEHQALEECQPAGSPGHHEVEAILRPSPRTAAPSDPSPPVPERRHPKPAQQERPPLGSQPKTVHKSRTPRFPELCPVCFPVAWRCLPPCGWSDTWRIRQPQPRRPGPAPDHRVGSSTMTRRPGVAVGCQGWLAGQGAGD